VRVKFFILIWALLTSLSALCEDKAASPAPEGNTICTFANGQQISLRYPEIAYDKKSELPRGKVWMPGNQPLYLFSETNLNISSTVIAPGAYSLYLIPREDKWTLVINKGVDKGAAYDPKKDVAKLQADTGKLPREADTLSLYFGRLAPKQCTLRIDYGKERAFAEFEQK
jgi:hypothetical protein